MAPAMNFAARQGNFACGLARTSSPTISHLSFANLWNHLPNDILGCKIAFCTLFPRRKAQGCGGKDSGNGGGHE